MTTANDPLCPARHDAIWEGDPPCKCAEYARVREDERAHPTDVAGYVSWGNHGYAAALRDAETAVLSVTREIDKDEMRWLFQGLRGER